MRIKLATPATSCFVGASLFGFVAVVVAVVVVLVAPPLVVDRLVVVAVESTLDTLMFARASTGWDLLLLLLLLLLGAERMACGRVEKTAALLVLVDLASTKAVVDSCSSRHTAVTSSDFLKMIIIVACMSLALFVSLATVAGEGGF